MMRAALLAVLLLAPALGIAAPPEEPRVLVVAFRGSIEAGDAEHLRAHGATVHGFVTPHGYLARLPPGLADHLARHAEVASVAPMDPAGKLAPGAASAAELVLVALPDADLRALTLAAADAGARVIDATPTARDLILRVAAGAPSTAAALAAREDVVWIEPAPPEPTLDNARASSIVQSGENAAWPLHDLGVNGSTQIVGFCDSGLDTDAPLALLAGRTVHELFADDAPLLHQVPSALHRKVALYYSPIDAEGVRGDMDDEDGHGTHVAGTLAGDAGTHGARDGHDGVAFAARLAVCDAMKGGRFQALADPAGYWQPAYDVGARVHSNSWGTTLTDRYLLAARQHDAYAWDHRDMLIVRSAGNSGAPGELRVESLAKSVLAVGASENDAANESVASFSARGPAADGRVKPDLVAPGRCVTSAALGGGYACREGTSQATPVVAGAAALVRDHFAKGLDGHGERGVSSALVRAVLVASAQPLAAAAPDAVEGWGRPELARALGADASLATWDEGPALVTGDVWSAPLVVAEGADVRVVLAWTDAPALAGATRALVNDLDLELVAPDGSVLAGNADLAAPDRLNAIERVLASDLPAGTYALRVRAHEVPMGPQPFALALTY